jgi:hypothetical protein
MGGKWIQLLKEVAPRTRRIAVIYNPETSSNELFLPGMRVSADASAWRSPSPACTVGALPA